MCLKNINIVFFWERAIALQGIVILLASVAHSLLSSNKAIIKDSADSCKSRNDCIWNPTL